MIEISGKSTAVPHNGEGVPDVGTTSLGVGWGVSVGRGVCVGRGTEVALIDRFSSMSLLIEKSP